MADDEKFLERWSRRKRDAAQPDAPAAPDEAPPPAPAEVPPSAPPAPTQTPAAAPPFDLASLPSLDSITATTDVRPFLAPGVPAELTRAALRRAWATDPTIRDFVGLQENDWDFNKPNSIAGFGALPPDYDLRKMVAELFGEGERATEHAAPSESIGEPATIPRETQTTAELSSAAREESTPPQDSVDHATAPVVEQIEIVQNSKTIALQHPIRRKHGSALPEE